MYYSVLLYLEDSTILGSAAGCTPSLTYLTLHCIGGKFDSTVVYRKDTTRKFTDRKRYLQRSEKTYLLFYLMTHRMIANIVETSQKYTSGGNFSTVTRKVVKRFSPLSIHRKLYGHVHCFLPAFFHACCHVQSRGLLPRQDGQQNKEETRT